MLALLALAVVAARGLTAPASTGRQPASALTIAARRAAGPVLAPSLFGLGVDVPSATYLAASASGCRPLPTVGRTPGLVRIGAEVADDYDWRRDDYTVSGNTFSRASPAPCSSQAPAASILRVLDRVRALRAVPIVVLNGEVDDPQSAAALVRVIRGRYGLGYARTIYWEIGDDPRQWQHFGIPLQLRRPDDQSPCEPNQYAALVTSYAAAIAVALDETRPDDPNPLIVASDWIARSTDQSWTDVVQLIDTSYYPFAGGNHPSSALDEARGVARPSSQDGDTLDAQVKNLDDKLAYYGAGGYVRVLAGQWNVDASQSSSFDYASSAQGVFVARVLTHLAARGIALAAWSSPVYGYSLVQTQTPFVDGQPTPGWRVFAALRTLAGARLVALKRVSSDVEVAALRRHDGRITLVVTNSSGRASPSFTLHVQGAAAHAVTAITQTFSQRETGASSTRSLNPSALRLVAPPLSVTLLTLPAR